MTPLNDLHIDLLFIFIALRRAIKSSLVKPEQEKSHVHSFPVGEEKYNAESDNWTKTCSECGFQVTFEKM